MPSVPRRLVLLSVPLLGAKVMAQDAPRERKLKRRRVTLSGSLADTPVELHVAPDHLTALEFDSPVDREGVKLGDAGGRFARVEVNDSLVVLKPAVELAPGERVLLTVPFADGLAPARAVFALITHASEVDVQVQVSRLPRTADAVQAELDEVRAACAGKEAELSALRTRSAVNGPAGMILAGLLDDSGVTAQTIHVKQEDGTGLKSANVITYKGRGWVALSLAVSNIGSEPWIPAEARLSLTTGDRLRVLQVTMKEARIEPGGKALVVVETGAEDWPEGARRLELRDSTGARPLLISSLVL